MGNYPQMNLVITGPCGVGKSTIAKSIADRMGIVFLDFDEHRATEMGNTYLGHHPCSVSYLNLKECLYTKLEKISTNFILDIGGDTIFRLGVDNEDRKNQIQCLKTRYSARIVLLTSERDVLFRRFSGCEKRKLKGINGLLEEFDVLWKDWLSIGATYWTSCADLVLDTTISSVIDTIKQVERILK
jgi:shikimate kinase